MDIGSVLFIIFCFLILRAVWKTTVMYERNKRRRIERHAKMAVARQAARHPPAPKVLDANWTQVQKLEKELYQRMWMHRQYPEIASLEFGDKFVAGKGPPNWWEQAYKEDQERLAKANAVEEIDQSIENIIALVENNIALAQGVPGPMVTGVGVLTAKVDDCTGVLNHVDHDFGYFGEH
jgi:hypothetical protein